MSTLYYSKNHMWISVENDVGRIGISSYVLGGLGSLLFVSLPEEGDEIFNERSFGDVESVKKVMELISPCDGNVIQINSNVVDNPSSIEADATTWLIEVRIKHIGDELMSDDEYIEYIKESESY